MPRSLFVLFLALAAPAVGFAQPAPYYAVVTDIEVKLYAGPSDKFPQTTLLKKGDVVIVHDETDGWLAVQDPPAIVRSMSWVRTQVVDFNKDKPIPQLVVVGETGATLRAGQMGVAQPSTAQRAKVPAATILTVIGPGVNFAEGTWYPVVPPVGDYRYLPKTSVRFDRPANNNVFVRDTTPPPISPAGGTGPAASIPGSRGSSGGNGVGSNTVNNPIWSQAEAAERDGRLDDAERLYFSLARQMNEPGGDRDIANLCYTRIHSIREKKRALPGGRSTSNTRPVTADQSRPTADRSLPPSAAPRDGETRRAGPGKLFRSGISIDGRRTYGLETAPGEVALYVVPGPGIDLERYVGKRVDVSGVVHTRQGLSKPYMVATGIE